MRYLPRNTLQTLRSKVPSGGVSRMSEACTTAIARLLLRILRIDGGRYAGTPGPDGGECCSSGSIHAR